MRNSCLITVVAAVCIAGSTVHAQPIAISNPTTTVTDSFGSPGGGGSLQFNFGGSPVRLNFARGSSRTISSTTPSLTVQNGFGGSIFSGQWRPFVTGVTPVVGGFVPGRGPVPYLGRDPVQPNYGYGNSMPRRVNNAVTQAVANGFGQSQSDNGATTEPAERTPAPNVIFSPSDSTAQRGDLSVREIRARRQQE